MGLYKMTFDGELQKKCARIECGTFQEKINEFANKENYYHREKIAFLFADKFIYIICNDRFDDFIDSCPKSWLWCSQEVCKLYGEKGVDFNKINTGLISEKTMTFLAYFIMTNIFIHVISNTEDKDKHMIELIESINNFSDNEKDHAINAFKNIKNLGVSV